MDKMKIKMFYFSKLFLFLIFFINISCSSVKIFSIKNNTDEAIEFRGKFLYKHHKPYDLDFTLNPGEIDSWRYEVSYMNKENLDIGLKKIILKNNTGCQIMLDRDTIEKIARKKGMWEININEDIMDCK